jgi:hypothetical protein
MSAVHVMGKIHDGWYCCRRLLRDASDQPGGRSPLATAVYRNFINRGCQNEVMEKGFPPPHHDPWAIVEVNKDTDPRSLYFWSASTDPNAWFSYEDQTWFEIPPSWINLHGFHHQHSVQVRCPDHNINHRIEVWLSPDHSDL